MRAIRPVFAIDAYTHCTFQYLGLACGDEHYETLQRMFDDGLGRDARHFNE